MKFVYKLKYEEAYETFFLLSMRWRKRTRNVLAAVMTLIALGMLAAYYLDSRKVHYFVIVILDILMLYYLIYVPVLKAKKGAKTVSRQNGTYKIELTSDGRIHIQGETIELAGDKDARAIEAEEIFAIRPDRLHTFCVPKRILSPDETDKVRNILKSNVKYVKM